jgi:mannose-1-phosphate guanylyltransferase
MDPHYYAVIMAGGGGTRLWPLSRQARPKQMLPLIGTQSLFQDAIRRLDGLFAMERILVVTTAQMAREFQAQCPGIPTENYLLEPQPRGTASVVGLAATALKQRDPEAVLAILTSDHYIGNVGRFQRLLRAALEVARQDYLVTLGITPTYAATGYGYIQNGEQLGESEALPFFRVARFKEKPALEQAKEMLASGQYAWNSGMFVWRAQTILNEFQRQMPGLFAQLQEIAQAWDTPQRDQVLQNIWGKVEVNTIDYGIMENARQVAVIPAAELDWNDVGTWESLYDILPRDENGNVIVNGTKGHTLAIDTCGTIIHAPETDRLIVAIGLEDVVIVDTGDVLLVCTKDRAQQVREAVNHIKITRPENT